MQDKRQDLCGREHRPLIFTLGQVCLILGALPPAGHTGSARPREAAWVTWTENGGPACLGCSLEQTRAWHQAEHSLSSGDTWGVPVSQDGIVCHLCPWGSLFFRHHMETKRPEDRPPGVEEQVPPLPVGVPWVLRKARSSPSGQCQQEAEPRGGHWGGQSCMDAMDETPRPGFPPEPGEAAGRAGHRIPASPSHPRPWAPGRHPSHSSACPSLESLQP